MALTPEDVVNKRFQPTKFREGYDQDEVDDFLDEVVVELRRLNEENAELRRRLEEGGEPAPTSAPADAGPAVEQPAADSGVEPVAAAPSEPAAPAVDAAPQSYSAPQVGDPNDPQLTNNLLQLARRLHEEHVREGMQRRDALIAEGHETAARVTAEAESQQKEQLATLEHERDDLQQRIDGLRTFEREYRQRLRGYIEGQLHDLDASGAPDAAGGDAQPQSFQGFGG